MSQHDDRTIDAVKRYLHFFKIPGFLEKKWKKKVKDSLDEWFAAYDALEESVGIKDEKLDALNIDDLLAVLERIQQQFADGAADLSAINDAIDLMLTELLTDMDLYCSALQTVIDEQNSYEWYTPKCYGFLAGNTLYLGYGNPPQEGDYYGSAVVSGVWTDFESTGSAPWQSVKSSIVEVRTLASFTQATVTAVSMWFNSCSNLATADLTYFNSRSVTAASNFMTGCDNLTTVILGQYTEIFMRFDNLVSQEYWYTDDTVLDGEKLYLAAYPGTYYSVSPQVTLSVSVQGLEDYDDDVTVTVTLSDGSTATIVCNSDNDYWGETAVPKYSGRAEIAIVSVSSPVLEGYEEPVFEFDGLNASVMYIAIQDYDYFFAVYQKDSEIDAVFIYCSAAATTLEGYGSVLDLVPVTEGALGQLTDLTDYAAQISNVYSDESFADHIITSLNQTFRGLSNINSIDFSNLRIKLDFADPQAFYLTFYNLGECAFYNFTMEMPDNMPSDSTDPYSGEPFRDSEITYTGDAPVFYMACASLFNYATVHCDNPITVYVYAGTFYSLRGIYFGGNGNNRNWYFDCDVVVKNRQSQTLYITRCDILEGHTLSLDTFYVTASEYDISPIVITPNEEYQELLEVYGAATEIESDFSILSYDTINFYSTSDGTVIFQYASGEMLPRCTQANFNCSIDCENLTDIHFEFAQNVFFNQVIPLQSADDMTVIYFKTGCEPTFWGSLTEGSACSNTPMYNIAGGAGTTWIENDIKYLHIDDTADPGYGTAKD